MTTTQDATITIIAMILMAALAIYNLDKTGDTNVLWAVLIAIAAKGGYSLGKTNGAGECISQIEDMLAAKQEISKS